MEDWKKLSGQISGWIMDYARKNDISTLVVGVSGGIDSAVTSALCANTGLRTIVLNMPIHQESSQYDLANQHIEWLCSNWKNVESHIIDLTGTFDSISIELKEKGVDELAIAGSNNGIVVGTGNKVEDFGVGFFTKYGDGGVDISPIADLFKSEVYSMAEALGIIQEIQEAAPTDGLWDDGRTDEEQMGVTYEELEWAMREKGSPSGAELTDRQSKVMDRYLHLNSINSHKMGPIPVFSRDDH